MSRSTGSSSLGRLRRLAPLAVIAVSIAAGVVPVLRVIGSEERDRTKATSRSSSGDGLDSMLTNIHGFVEVGTVVAELPTSPKEYSYPAEVVIEEVVWQSAALDLPKEEEWAPLGPGGPVVIVSGDPMWAAISSEVGKSRVYLGLGPNAEEGTYDLRFAFAVDAGLASFVAPGWTDDGLDAVLNGFASWDGNPMAGRPVEQFVAGWAAEIDAGRIPYSVVEAGLPDLPVLDEPRVPTRIQRAWERYFEEVLYPQYDPWEDRSPDYRSLFDAPPGVLDQMRYAEVWVYVPERATELLASWRDFDGGLCVRNSQGFAGCFMPRELDSAGGHLFPLESYAVIGEDVTITAHPEDPFFADVPAAGPGTPIGSIGFQDVLDTGIVLVTLPPIGPSSYADLQANASTYQLPLASVGPITELELGRLLELEDI